MGLFEFFFPHEAQAVRIDQIARTQQLLLRRSSTHLGTTMSRIRELEQDLGYVALVLGSILSKLDEKGVVSRDDLKQEMARLDELDGVKDGKLDIRVLRGLHAT